MFVRLDFMLFQMAIVEIALPTESALEFSMICDVFHVAPVSFHAFTANPANAYYFSWRTGRGATIVTMRLQYGL